jgi:hypothetical protein
MTPPLVPSRVRDRDDQTDDGFPQQVEQAEWSSSPS